MNEKLKLLIEALVKKTKNKQAVWNLGSGDNQFKLILPDGIAVTVSEYQQQYNQSEYSIAIFNSRGDVIQRYGTDDSSVAEDFNLLSEFHSAARDEYYKVDETFDALIKSINSEETIGKMDEKPQANIPAEVPDDLPF